MNYKGKIVTVLILMMAVMASAQEQPKDEPTKTFFIDVHKLGPGNVSAEAVAKVHLKDLEVQETFDVNFLRYWVDETNGIVYCLSGAPDSTAVTETHKHAHGLLPHQVLKVSEGVASVAAGDKKYFLDIHQLGEGKVTAEAVAHAHEKDLAVQDQFGVNFINYWVDENKGIVICLSEANDSTRVISTHKEAHGLIPDSIVEVIQGE